MDEENINREEIAMKAYEKLDLIRIISRLSINTLKQDESKLDDGSFEILFEEIIKNCWDISENVETLSKS